MNRQLLLLCLMMLMPLGLCAQTSSPAEMKNEIVRLKSQVEELEHKVKKIDASGLVLFLFGTFCALWAQNTGRGPWLWFFLGLIGSVITVIVLLVKNSNDRYRESLRVKLN